MNMREQGSPTHSAKFLRQRKFLLVMPVLVLPFLLLLVWTLGLVGEAKGENAVAKKEGINLQLPDAAPSKDSNWNKLRYYEQADRDSVKLRTMLKNDPYRKLEVAELMNSRDRDTVLGSLEASTKNEGRRLYDPYPKEKETQDYNERRVHIRLAALNKELEMARIDAAKPLPDKESKSKNVNVADVPISPDVQRLETMMKAMQQGPEEDSELKELNSLLEKVMDIQHPQRMEDKLKTQSEQYKRQVFPVHTKKEEIISVLENTHAWQERLSDQLPDSTVSHVQQFFERNRFYSLDEVSEAEPLSTSIEAFVPTMQTVMNGTVLQLRLLQELLVNGVLIPAQTPVSGTVSLKGMRMQVAIESIYYNKSVFPVNLMVYSNDGLPGLPLDGSALNDVAKQTMTGTMQNVDLDVMGSSIGAQAASAGLQAVKTLTNKKARVIKITIPSGYTVLLVDANQKDKK